MKKYHLSFLAIFLNILQLINGQLPQNWVYSPQYSYLVKANNQQSLFSKILVSSSTGLIFISAGDDGIKVIDPNQQFNVTASLKTKEHIEGFAITQDANYIFLSKSSMLTIYSFNVNTFTQVGQDNQQVFITDIIINKAEDTLYILQVNGVVRILDISQKSNPTFIGQITWYPQQIYGAFLSDDEKFLFISQDYQGLGIFTINKQKKQITGKLLGSYPGATQGSSHKSLITPDKRYLINLDQRNGLSFADFSQVINADLNHSPYSFQYFLNQWWPSEVTVPSPYSMCLSKDSNFLFIGVRSIGIYTIDITNIYSPSTYIWAYFSHHGNSIALSPTSNYLYFSNSVSFMAFRRMKPLLGNKYVSLYNGNHSVSFNYSDTRYYWRCDFDPYRQIYIGAFDTDGLWFIDTSNPVNLTSIQSSYKPPGSNANIDVFYPLNNYKVLITPMNDGVNFIAVLDVSSYTNIQVIQKVPLGLPVNGYVKDIDGNSQNTLIVVAIDRVIVFVDIKTIGSFFVIALWEFLPYMKGLTTGVMLSYNQKYFIGACRGYGYFVLDIQDFKNIKLVNYIESNGAEQVYKSTTFNYQYYLIDGLGGLYIMDQTKLPQFIQFSQIDIEGWTNDITYLQNEQTVIVATMQQGMIYLIDISDNQNPFIVSSYQYSQQNGFVSCATQDFSKLFIDNNLEMRLLPLTVPVQLHTDYLEILGYTEQGDMIFNIINDPDSFKFLVGQKIKLNFCFLYEPLDLVVSNVKFIQNQVELPFPTWIVYDPVEISAVVTITNNAVNPANLSQPLLNTLVLTTIRPLSKYDFLFKTKSCTTSLEQAEAIFNQLQEDGIIDENNLVPSTLSFNSLQFIQMKNTNLFPNSTPKQQDDNYRLSQQLKYTLLNSIQNTPVYFLVYPSLNLVIDGSTQSYISTTAPLVSIQIEIPKFYGKFIFSNQVSVNISVNPEMNIIIITGRSQNVNNFLSQKVIIFPISPIKYRDITATITITDSMNYPIVKTAKTFQFPFLSEKQNIQQNPNKKLQNQFEDDIEIETQFSFGIDPQTFIVPDINTKVTYTILRMKGGQFVPLDNSDWLQFDNQLNKFYGIPPQSAFQTSIEIEVLGSDGYTSTSQTFVIHVTRLPLTLLLQLLVTILGPLTGLFGLYKFRGDFYNIFYSKRNMYSRVSCKPNQQFILKIPLILNEVTSSIDIMNSLEKKLKSIQKQQKKLIKMLRLPPSERQSLDQQQQNQRSNKKKVTKLMKLNTTITQGINYFQELVSVNINSIAQNYKKRLETLQKSEKKSQFEKFYLKSNGSLDYQLFLEHIIEYDFKFKFNNQNTSTKLMKEELTKEHSALEQCLKFQLAIKLMKFDQKSQVVFDFLKYYSLVTNPNLTNNDWYKYLINIKQTDDLDTFGNAIVFPSFSFYYLRLSKALKLIDIQIDKEILNLEFSEEILINQKKERIYDQIYKDKEINLYLIEQYMYSHAAGVKSKLPNSFFPSIGESIYIDSHEINSLVALRYNPGACECFEKFFGLDFKPYGPQGNIQLPNWLSLETLPSLIVLKGKPDFSNAEDLLIKISTIQNYNIRKFMLNVEKDLIQFNHFRKSILSKKQTPKNKHFKKKGQRMDIPISSSFNSKKNQTQRLTYSKKGKSQNQNQLIQFSEEEEEELSNIESGQKSNRQQQTNTNIINFENIFSNNI
ncbi:hypothetical protein TTHERM_00266500 (macronuclear) [Tetrahymena thermophila SB210]|uniref:Dystroglycan-type cadherin-like domain-containing protein n=1 Tax=Tetrahymena thermophila (strain SB210) TaxID=312017 RepID=I7M175_TETTS|nr:hypothetical protein TTHERM_00266500 [Tetrahymena thermophila SB210]EAR95640.2 hypothetical protein TTHERM_00266500 [Tetrahymena thermophila SB210]|eukprot:XP_001015885.2 hypothetical protein TTHERM_00266500 [Tetrahymena thermophila SB210]